MNKFLILKDNKVTNSTLGRPLSLKKGETVLEATGSNSTIERGDYYLPDSQTYYSPIQPQLNELVHVSSSFMGIVGTGSHNITVAYSEDITPTPIISTLTSEEVTISNFSASSNSFSFNIAVTDEFLSSSLDEITVIFDHNNITDTNNNPLWSRNNNRIDRHIFDYTGSI
jgi:hypothetical protein